MRTLFSPLVASVYAHDGYIVGFAGDAFTAVFPSNPNHNNAALESAINALAGAWEIQTYLQTHDQYSTEYGVFQIGAKIGLSFGEIEWGILQAKESKRATFFYKGDAIQASSNGEQVASRKEIICDRPFYTVTKEQIEAEPRGDFFVVTAVETPLPPQKLVQYKNQSPELMSHFFPEQLITQSISGEFRQILNLFINIKGTPAPEELAAFMETVFTLQDRYGGLLNRIDFGDKGCHLLFFWGAPSSYENDISRVLGFVQDLQQHSTLVMRMGITYRIAHAGFIGSELHEEYTCYGRGVNLAARFMTSAAWGQIWVDGEIAERTGHLFQFEYLGPNHFKGFTDTQDVFQLNGRRQIAQAPFYQGRLVGREAEMAQLQTFAEPMLNGRFAGVVLISGEAGIGKSRLIYEYLEQSDIFEDAEVFLCQTDEIVRQSLNPFRYWLRDFFNQSSTAVESENKANFDRILNNVINEIVGDALKSELDRTRSFLGALLGLHWPDSLYEQLEPQLRFENILNALKALIKAESTQKPIIIQIEDAHWMDEDSWHFLKRLTRNIENIPLAIIITTREAFPENVREPEVPFTEIHLSTLPIDAAKQLVQEKTGDEPPEQFLEWLMQRTEGNPFFVEQMILYLEENNIVINSEKQLDLLKTGNLLPTDVRSVLTARLDQLPLAVKEAIQTASVLGREFDKPVLAEMLNNDPKVNQTLKIGTDESIWILLSQIRYLFRHMLLRDAAYEMQVQTRLKTLHKQAATAFETIYQTDLTPYYGQIAYHYDQAMITVKAVDYYERAADQARESYRNEEALDQYNRALTLTKLPNFERRFRLFLGKEAILNWLGRREEQEEVLNQLNTLLDDSEDISQQSEVHLRHAAYALATNQYDKAIEAAKASADTAVVISDILAEARAYHRWGRAYWQQGKFQNALPYINKALQLSREQKSPIEEAKNLYDLSVVHFYENKYQLAINFLELAQTLYELENDQSGVISCQLLKGIILSNSGKYVLAQETNQNVLKIARELGWRYAEARALMVIGNTSLELGAYFHAENSLEEAIIVYKEIGDWAGLASSLDSLGLISFFLGNYKKANSYFIESTDINERIQQLSLLAYALTHQGYCLIELNNHLQAQAVLKKALQIRQELDMPNLRIDPLAALAFSAASTNDTNAASKHITFILEWLDKHSSEGIEFPALVYLTCFKSLKLLGKEYEISANEILEIGYRHIQERAKAIEDPVISNQYLNNVPYHFELISYRQNINS